MRSNIHGNYGYEGHGLSKGGATQGFGTQVNNSIVANLSIAGSADKVVYIPATAILSLKYDQGLSFQAVGCDVEVSYTNENWNYACSQQANESNLIHWCNTLTVKQGTIQPSELLAFCALRLVFKGTGILYLAAR